MRSPVWKRIASVCALWLASSLAGSAQTFKTLVNFNGANGSHPALVILAQGRDGNLWGTAQSGGIFSYGTIFRLTPGGTLTTAYSFDLATGAFPDVGLTLGRDNYFYGVNGGGGVNGYGVVFTITPTGSYTVIFNFDGTNGTAPEDALTQGIDGNFYGTTSYGPPGVGPCGANGCGTIFKISPKGTATTLWVFDLNPDGAFPLGGLLQATDGNFYGTASAGGIPNVCTPYEGCGTVFRITPGGTLTLIHRFQFTDGAYPAAGLIQGSDGNLYGTTEFGGTNKHGTVFKITLGGTLTTLYNFTGSADGKLPYAPLVEGTDGNFYGTTVSGGSSIACAGGCGTIFQITSAGVLTTLHTFTGTDGDESVGGLVQHSNGLFYGTTEFGGASDLGTIFSIDMGLGPFIKTTTTLGKVGSRVQILGQGLTGSTSVTFNGTPAMTFNVDGDTYMTAIVPTGATTGPVQVTTPTGTLTSNVNFRVAP